MTGVTVAQAILLGILQGVTEFLPVSSSGHLVIAERLLGARVPGLVGPGGVAFEVAVHLGTLASVLVYFRARLARMIRSLVVRSRSGGRRGSATENATEDVIENRRLVWYLVLGTLPAVAVGLLFESLIVKAFASPRYVAGEIMVTGLILVATHFVAEGSGRVRAGSALVIGVAQALSISPGISRSGATISTGLYMKISRAGAAEFSFLLSIPAILGAAVLELRDLPEGSGALIRACGIGALVAFVVALATIGWLMRVVRAGKLAYFGVYCLLAGAFFMLVL